MSDPRTQGSDGAPSAAGAEPRQKREKPTPLGRADRRFGRRLVYPTVLLLVAGGIVPLVYSIWTSFVANNLRTQGNPFVGFENYARVLTDPLFRRQLLFTFMLTAIVVTIEVLLGTSLALILSNRSKRWRRIMIPLIIAPMFISSVVTGQIFRLFTARVFGPVNYVLSLVTGQEISVDWLGTYPANLVTIVAADVWQWTGLTFLIVYSALTGLDHTLEEAAEVDGARRWQVLRYITLPLISPALATAVFFRTADALRIYDKIVTISGGGPGRATSTVTFYLVQNGFSGSFDLSVAAAASWVFLIVVAALFYRSIKKRVLS